MYFGKWCKGERGSALAITLIIMVVLTILGTAFLNLSVAENKFANRNEDRLQAYYIARSGAQTVAEYMVEDHNDDATDMVGHTSDPNTQVGGGSFTVSVEQDPDNANIINITSIGTYNNISQTSKIQVSKTSSGVGGLFNHAMVAYGDIDVSNESGQGIDIDGSIVTITGTIDGNLDGKYTEEGSGVDSTINLPDINMPSGAIELGVINYNNAGTIVFPRVGDTGVTKPNGVIEYTYHADSITLQNTIIKIVDNSGATPVENRPNLVVHIYVDGNINLATNAQLTAEDDTLLYVYCEGDSVLLSGAGENNNIYIYAPSADISWQNAQNHNLFFGGLVGNTITIANKINVEHNPLLASYSQLDTTNVGINYTGYKWID